VYVYIYIYLFIIIPKKYEKVYKDLDSSSTTYFKFILSVSVGNGGLMHLGV